METNLQQAGASDSWGKAACTPGLALWRRGGTAGKPRSALPQLPAAAAAGGGKLRVMEELPGWGVRRRKIQLHRQGLPDGRNLLVRLPASDALTEIGFENAQSLPALPCPAGEWTPPYTTLWSLLAIPRAGFVSLNTQLPRNSLRGHGPNLVFFQETFQTNPNPNSSGVLLVSA